MLETDLAAQRKRAFAGRSAVERALRANAIDNEPVTDTDDMIGDDISAPPARRRLSRSYFAPPARWGAAREAARERIHRDSRRW